MEGAFQNFCLLHIKEWSIMGYVLCDCLGKIHNLLQ